MTELNGCRKKAAHWEDVDWSLDDEEIAADTRCRVSYVRVMRKRVKDDPHFSLRIRRRVDWGAMDWTGRRNKDVCRETGRCYGYVSMQRTKHAYGTARMALHREILERWDVVVSSRSCLEAAERLGMHNVTLRRGLEAMGKVPGHWQRHERADVKIKARLDEVLAARDCAHAARICGACPWSVREWLEEWGLVPAHWRRNRGAEEVDAGIRARLDEVLATRSITEAARLAGCAPSIVAGRLRRWGLAPMWEGKIGKRLRMLAAIE